MITNKVWARGYASVDLDGNENSVLIKVTYAFSIQTYSMILLVFLWGVEICKAFLQGEHCIWLNLKQQFFYSNQIYASQCAQLDRAQVYIYITP